MNLLSLAIALGSGYVIYKAIDTAGSALELAKKLDYYVSVSDVKFGTSLKLILDLRVVNPTGYDLKLSYPLVMLYITGQNGEDDDFIAQNPVYDQEFELKAYSETIIPGLTFEIGYSSIIKLLELSFNKTFTLSDLYNSVNSVVEAIRKNITYKLYIKVNGVDVKYSSTLEGLGYSPISAIDRPIENCSQYDKFFKRPQFKTKQVADIAEAENTVELMRQIIKRDAKLIKDFSELFRTNDVKKTAKKIYDFVYRCLKYNIEKGEQLKNPLVSYELAQRKAREFYSENGFYHPDYTVDCDDISIFIGSILYNLKIPFSLRLAQYMPNRGFQHVYIVAYDKDGSEIIIDPVFWKFNAEKTPLVKKDIPLSGFYDELSSVTDGVKYLYGLGGFTVTDWILTSVFPHYGIAKAVKEYAEQKDRQKQHYQKINKQLTTSPPDNSLYNELKTENQSDKKGRLVYVLLAGGLLLPVGVIAYKSLKNEKNDKG